jgi:hypothetical protein
MSSAAEARFRVQAPNSTPRAVTVIALDAASEPVVRRLADRTWNRASFFTANVSGPHGRPEEATFGSASLTTNVSGPRDRSGDAALGSAFTLHGTLRDLAGQPLALDDRVAAADLIVMVASAGGQADAAAAIGRASSDRRVMTTALIIGTETASEAALAKTLAQVRPWSLMVVMADADDYIEDMLQALRA